MRASDVMRTPVVGISPDSPVIDAVHLLMETNRRGLPVIDKAGNLVGIISEGDFLHRAELGTDQSDRPWFNAFFGPGESASNFAHAHGLRVEDIMTESPVCADENMDLNEVVDLMERHHIAQIPVVCGVTVVGMISRAELLAAIERETAKSELFHANNIATRDDILAAIWKASWSAGALVDIIVADGNVEMWGVIVDPNQRNALRSLIEHMPGVVRVSDHLTLHNSPLL
jgi:CBS domain-containing protein